MRSEARPRFCPTWAELCAKKQRSPLGRPFYVVIPVRLERGFDLESPSFKQRLRDVLRILVAPSPLAQTGGAQILVWREFVFADHLLELGNSRSDGPDRFGLTPVRISASLSHRYNASCVR